MFVAVGVMVFVLGLLIGQLLQKKTSPSLSMPDINLSSPSVKSAGILYLVSGTINKVTPASTGEIEVEILDSKGSLVAQKFTISNSSSNIVRSKDSKEERITTKEIKNGQSILLNYYIDLKTNQGQVSKVVIINN